LFALALGLPEDFFADKITKPAAIMRLLYYPPQTGIVDDRTIGIGSHTDYEVFYPEPELQNDADCRGSASRFCGSKMASTPYRF